MACLGQKIDKKTGLLYFVKRPAPESLMYKILLDLLISGIASVPVFSIENLGPNIETDSLVISEVVPVNTDILFRASGGTLNNTYKIKIVIPETISGNTVVEYFLIKVMDDLQNEN